MKATLTAEEFNTLVRLAQAVDLVQAQAQLAHGRALGKRDAYYAQLAAAYQLPPTWGRFAWNEETYEITVEGEA